MLKFIPRRYCIYAHERTRLWRYGRVAAILVFMLVGLSLLLVNISSRAIISVTFNSSFLPTFKRNCNLPQITPSNFISKLPSLLITEPDFCRRNKDLDIIAYVHSEISAVEKRKETRATWAGMTGMGLGVVFMVGHARTLEEQNIIYCESRIYRDIVQGNYTDTYHTLTLKAVVALNWVSNHCAHIPWTMHADDDVLIDVIALSKYLKKQDPQDEIFCYRWASALVMRRGKWCVELEDFPSKRYPTYCGGAMWVMATSGVPQLLEASVHVPPVWVDDAYITGILVTKTNLTHAPQFRKRLRRKGAADKDIGKVMAWFDFKGNRTLWWNKILKYHKSQTTTNSSVIT